MRRSERGLLLLSVAVALALLFVVHGERLVSYSFSVPLEARLPSGLEATTPLPANLHVSVSGPWARLRSLDGSDIGPVTIDLSRTGPGVASWFVRPESLRLPAGVRVESLYPSQGTVELKRE
ncbi:MAG TPA: hypothetical protein VMK12_02310 [Anaeromyxobacteraceae bacterium]|nr:hypothetical protein [Anaeromyxobacteraceae bacterium]